MQSIVMACQHLQTRSILSLKVVKHRKRALQSMTRCNYYSWLNVQTFYDQRQNEWSYMRFHSLMVEALLYVNRNRRFIMDGIPGVLSSDCKFCLLASFFFFFSVALRAQRRYGLLGTGSRSGWPSFHTLVFHTQLLSSVGRLHAWVSFSYKRSDTDGTKALRVGRVGPKDGQKVDTASHYRSWDSGRCFRPSRSVVM